MERQLEEVEGPWGGRLEIWESKEGNPSFAVVMTPLLGSSTRARVPLRPEDCTRLLGALERAARLLRDPPNAEPVPDEVEVEAFRENGWELRLVFQNRGMYGRVLQLRAAEPPHRILREVPLRSPEVCQLRDALQRYLRGESKK